MRREYKTGSKWAFWRWKTIHFGSTPYLDRLHLVHTPLGGVMLHWFYGPDPQNHRHDHPVDFLSIVLRGNYIEERPVPGGFGLVLDGYIRWFNLMRSTGIHRIVWVKPGTITLVFYGPNRRKWGFHTRDGWVHWQDYVKRHGWD